MGILASILNFRLAYFVVRSYTHLSCLRYRVYRVTRERVYRPLPAFRLLLRHSRTAFFGSLKLPIDTILGTSPSINQSLGW